MHSHVLVHTHTHTHTHIHTHSHNTHSHTHTHTHTLSQLKDEFIHAKLYPPVSINTAVWMAAIDMAGEANAKNKSLEELM